MHDDAACGAGPVPRWHIIGTAPAHWQSPFWQPAQSPSRGGSCTGGACGDLPSPRAPPPFPRVTRRAVSLFPRMRANSCVEKRPPFVAAGAFFPAKVRPLPPSTPLLPGNRCPQDQVRSWLGTLVGHEDAGVCEESPWGRLAFRAHPHPSMVWPDVPAIRRPLGGPEGVAGTLRPSPL